MTWILCLLIVAAEPAAPELKLSCELASSDLQVGDPVLVRLKLVNHGRDIERLSPPTFAIGSTLEARRSETLKFEQVWTKTSGKGGGFGRMDLHKGDIYTDFDVVLPFRNTLLAMPGEYELRVRTRVNDISLSSPVVRLRLRNRPEGELQRIAAHAEELKWGLDALYMSPRTIYAKELLDLEESLGLSGMRTMLIWRRMIREYEPNTESARFQAQAIRDIQRVVDPITADVMRLCLSWHLMHHDEWELAIEVLQPVKERNIHVESTRRECESELKRNAKRGLRRWNRADYSPPSVDRRSRGSCRERSCCQ